MRDLTRRLHRLEQRLVPPPEQRLLWAHSAAHARELLARAGGEDVLVLRFAEHQGEIPVDNRDPVRAVGHA